MRAVATGGEERACNGAEWRRRERDATRSNIVRAPGTILLPCIFAPSLYCAAVAAKGWEHWWLIAHTSLPECAQSPRVPPSSVNRILPRIWSDVDRNRRCDMRACLWKTPRTTPVNNSPSYTLCVLSIRIVVAEHARARVCICVRVCGCVRARKRSANGTDRRRRSEAQPVACTCTAFLPLLRVLSLLSSFLPLSRSPRIYSRSSRDGFACADRLRKRFTYDERGCAAMRDLGEGRFVDGIASTVSDKTWYVRLVTRDRSEHTCPFYFPVSFSLSLSKPKFRLLFTLLFYSFSAYRPRPRVQRWGSDWTRGAIKARD